MQARCGRPRQRGGHRRTDQPAGIDAPGAQPAARRGARAGELQPGATIPLNDSSTYPSTEQTLSSLSAVVNGGGLGQIGDIIHNFNAALCGREPEIRDLLTRLDNFVGILDAQRDNIIATIQRAEPRRRHVRRAARRHRPRAATDSAGARRADQGAADASPPRWTSSARSATPRHRLVNDTEADLVTNLQNLEPTLKALADVGPDLDACVGLRDGLPVRPELRRPRRPRRLHQPVRHLRPHRVRG